MKNTIILAALFALAGAIGSLPRALVAAQKDAPEARQDIVVADFEGADYGEWKATGTAFGAKPAQGTLPGQMTVSGYDGRGLVNSFLGKDDATGTLTSPPIKLERKYVNFLIGGGGYAGQTCVNLLLDGKVVRTAAGPNVNSGGSERLDWHAWDVSDLAGKAVVFQIVDNRKGGWGHINIDHILQSDRRRGVVTMSREIVAASRYLHLPVRTGAPMRRMRVIVDGKKVREFDIELMEGEKSFWSFCDISAFHGKTLVLEASLPSENETLAKIAQSDELKGGAAKPSDAKTAELYQERLRPQFHFTSRRGWLNDPNGLVFHDGVWHLFYQHNPYGWNWGNMHWGHAMSKNLFDWREQPIALYPRKVDDMAFSGSAVVDRDNTIGVTGAKGPVLVAAYTSTGRGECIVYSLDNGATWTEHSANPVVKHVGRDPKLIWHAPTKRWVMAVYTETEGKRWIAFHSSPNLTKWTFESRIEGYFECPDLFELPIMGSKKDQSRWVLYAADGRYVVGKFDGKTFVPETQKQQLWHGHFYAAQTYSEAPDNRRIQIGWAQGITFPDMPFNQQMTVPVELTLRETKEGPRMFAEPVAEFAQIREVSERNVEVKVQVNGRAASKLEGELLDVETEFEVRRGGVTRLVVRGVPIEYDAKMGLLTCQRLRANVSPLENGRLRLRALVDRGSMEIFVNGGQVAMSVAVVPNSKERTAYLTAVHEETVAPYLTVHRLRSVWPKP